MNKIKAWSADGKGTEEIELGDGRIMDDNPTALSFTPEEDARLISLRNSGMKWAAVAAAMMRPKSTVAGRFYYIGNKT